MCEMGHLRILRIAQRMENQQPTGHCEQGFRTNEQTKGCDPHAVDTQVTFAFPSVQVRHLLGPNSFFYGLPWWLRWYRICLLMQETWVRPLGREDPLEEKWLSNPVSLSEAFDGPRSLVGYSPWICYLIGGQVEVH